MKIPGNMAEVYEGNPPLEVLHGLQLQYSEEKRAAMSETPRGSKQYWLASGKVVAIQRAMSEMKKLDPNRWKDE